MHRSFRLIVALMLPVALLLSACNRQKATIIPKLQVNKKSAEMGTPVEITYSFSTKKEYVAVNKDLTVFCHFLDPKNNIRFQDDHLPSIPTSQWRPNGNYHYTRTLFIPKNIPAGEYKIAMGLYAPDIGQRMVLDSKAGDRRAYDMGTLLIEIPPQEPVIQYVRGWYDPETLPNDVSMRWRWIKKEAVMKVRNPNADALLYFKADANTEHFQPNFQTIKLTVGDTVVDSFTPTDNRPFLKKYNVVKNSMGTGKTVEVKVEVDKTFVPAEDKVSQDTRELGIRVYELYLGKASD